MRLYQGIWRSAIDPRTQRPRATLHLDYKKVVRRSSKPAATGGGCGGEGWRSRGWPARTWGSRCWWRPAPSPISVVIWPIFRVSLQDW